MMAITVTVIELTGKSIEVSSLGALHTVAELKQEVAAATGGDVARLQLVYKNAPLEDGSTLPVAHTQAAQASLCCEATMEIWRCSR